MTSTIQMTKPLTAMQEWKTIFPDFTTLTGSCLFIKKLMAVSLSAITYVRGVFPERAYGERSLSGIKLKLLSEETGVDSVDKFISLIRSCYDAVDKKYLHQLSIGIYSDAENRDEVLESYTMTFRYREDEFSVSNKTGSMKLKENDPTIEATVWLLKSIFHVSDILDPLPKEAYLTIKLLYYDDITPPDYQPPGFEPSDNEKFHYPPNPVKLEIGKVSTELHGYKMYLKSSLIKEPIKEPISQLLEESRQDSQRSGLNVEMDQNEEVILPTQTELRSKSSNAIEVNGTQQEEKVECVCKCKQDNTDLLQCSVCGRKQHSICYGILKPNEFEFEFYCVQCSNDISGKSACQDMIYTYEGDEQMELSALRRALVLCTSLKQVTPFQLEKSLKCNKQLARGLIERLEFEGFIRRSGQKYIVNENKIMNNGFREYFSVMKNKEKMENSKTKVSKTKPAEVIDLEGGSDGKKKFSFRTSDQRFRQDECMDFNINEEVQNLNLRGSSGKETNKPSRRRSLRVMTENEDSEELFHEQPRKKRTLSSKEKIVLRM